MTTTTRADWRSILTARAERDLISLSELCDILEMDGLMDPLIDDYYDWRHALDAINEMIVEDTER